MGTVAFRKLCHCGVACRPGLAIAGPQPAACSLASSPPADDFALRRFLRARKHNILKAKQMFLEQLKWRKAAHADTGAPVYCSLWGIGSWRVWVRACLPASLVRQLTVLCV